MLVSVEWLEELINTTLDLEKTKKALLDLGIETESQTSMAPPGVVTGIINTIAPHPRQSGLYILDIKANKKIQIVTAAQNIKKNDVVLVCPAGITFRNKPIDMKEFDGVTSEGTLVSEEELGIAEKSTGVIVLEHAEAGRAFSDYFDDTLLEIKTFPNRFDWLSMIGVAREVAIGLGLHFRRDNTDKTHQLSRIGSYPITIKDTQGCPRYTARIFEDVSIDESPFWMKWRLHCLGMKGINNIVDITNLNMLLYGQPLHPFDLDLLKKGITIRRAKNMEEFITLEGTILELNKSDVVIADEEGPIALAGIIGSRRAQISSTTTRILLESAYFEPMHIARTARRLNLRTEASIRFERGADHTMVEETSKQTSVMFQNYAHARETEHISCGRKMHERHIKLQTLRMNRILSLKLSDNTVKKMLKRANIVVTGNKLLTARIPHYRGDLQIEEDIYEEVARLYGYMEIPEVTTSIWVPLERQPKSREFENTIRNFMVGRGFNETYNLSLVSSKRLSELGYKNFVTIKNPLNERFDSLRPTLLAGLLDCVAYNLSKGNNDLQLFEIGNVLKPEEPFQEKHVAAIMKGIAQPHFWTDNDKKLAYFDAKGTVEAIFCLCHIQNIQFKHCQEQGFSQCARISHSNLDVGLVGITDVSSPGEECIYFELNMDKLWPLVSESFYTPPAKFPANIRDLSFLVNMDVEAPDIIALIRKVGGPVLDKIYLFDYYKGKNIADGKKNFGFRLYFRAPDRTLGDTEVEIFVKKIVHEVAKQYNATLRTKETNWMN